MVLARGSDPRAACPGSLSQRSSDRDRDVRAVVGSAGQRGEVGNQGNASGKDTFPESHNFLSL